MGENSLPQSGTESIDSRFLSPTGIGLLKGLAAMTATVIPAGEGYFHAQSGMPPQPSYALASLIGALIGLPIEFQRPIEIQREVTSKDTLKNGYRIFRWPVGITAAYLGMYKMGYFFGNLSRD